jgi:hypothetical protein
MSPRLISAIIAVAFAGTGCIRSTTDLVVEEDGSGSVDIVLAVDPSAITEADPSALPPGLEALVGGDSEEICQQVEEETAGAGVPEGAVVTAYDEDGFCGSRIKFDFGSAEELGNSLQGTVGDETTSASEFVLRQEEDGWLFRAPLTVALPQDGAGLPPAMVQAVLSDAVITYRVTLPGEAVAGEHNATSVDGGVFFWDIDLGAPPDLLMARTTERASPAGGLLLPIVIGGAVLAALAAAAYGLARRRSSGPGDLAAGTITSPAPSGVEWGPAPAPATFEPYEPATPWPTGATPDEPITPEPRWDPDRGAWVADHPTEGLLIHDDDAGQWRRA